MHPIFWLFSIGNYTGEKKIGEFLEYKEAGRSTFDGKDQLILMPQSANKTLPYFHFCHKMKTKWLFIYIFYSDESERFSRHRRRASRTHAQWVLGIFTQPSTPVD